MQHEWIKMQLTYFKNLESQVSSLHSLTSVKKTLWHIVAALTDLWHIYSFVLETTERFPFGENHNLSLSTDKITTAGKNVFQSVGFIGFQPRFTLSNMPWIHSLHPPLWVSAGFFSSGDKEMEMYKVIRDFSGWPCMCQTSAMESRREIWRGDEYLWWLLKK